jgi:transposase
VARGTTVAITQNREWSSTPVTTLASVPSASMTPPTMSICHNSNAAKKVNGRKRHIAVDTGGLLLAVLVTAASVQDRDAGRLLLAALRTCFPRIGLTWVDAGYAGALVDWAATTLRLTVTVVHKLVSSLDQAMSQCPTSPRHRRYDGAVWPGEIDHCKYL